MIALLYCAAEQLTFFLAPFGIVLFVPQVPMP
jgi:hypothetical protein